jgi:hypothetical protein
VSFLGLRGRRKGSLLLVKPYWKAWSCMDKRCTAVWWVLDRFCQLEEQGNHRAVPSLSTYVISSDIPHRCG